MTQLQDEPEGTDDIALPQQPMTPISPWPLNSASTAAVPQMLTPAPSSLHERRAGTALLYLFF